MYQLEVKARLVAALFPKSEGWFVTVDIDAMERARGGSHSPGKLERVQVAEAMLRDFGAQIGAHPRFGRADVVAEHPDRGIVVVEVEGKSSRQREQAMYSALGQIILLMRDFTGTIRYAIAVPDTNEWEYQLTKVPVPAAERLRLSLYLVSETGVRKAELRKA